ALTQKLDLPYVLRQLIALEAAMATVALPAMRHRFDNLFSTGMLLVMLGTVFLAFAKTYFLAGVFRAPLPNLLIHMHGVAFTSWMLLLITQKSLVSAGRVDIHR